MSSTSASAFVDTNVLVYSFDSGEPVKRKRAQEVVERERERLVLSAQVLGEFYVVVTRKLETPVSLEDALAAVRLWSRFRTVPLDGALVGAAIRISQTARISYWDGLIVAAARAAGCDRILTEDLADGTAVEGVAIENPFR